MPERTTIALPYLRTGGDARRRTMIRAVMHPRPINTSSDLREIADLLGHVRARGGLSHPGGIQWWLRELAADDRDDFGAYVWSGEDGAIDGFALVDGTFAVVEGREPGDVVVEQVAWLEDEVRSLGREALEVHVAAGDPLRATLERRGFVESGSELELVADVAQEPTPAPLPAGFRFGSLRDITDEAYIEGHRAAWSDRRPSTYGAVRHDAIKRMPQFRPELVTVVIAPDGSVAASCIGWMDEQSRTLEIEPLGTHRRHRRLGLAHAVVKEVQRRAWASGARSVLVWNDPASNPAAYALYTGAGMPPRRTLIALRKELNQGTE
jgi:GNAT superfamily N-acetyltransferase